MKTSRIFPKLTNETLGLHIIKTYNDIRLSLEYYSYLGKIKEEAIGEVSLSLDNKLILFEDHSPNYIWNSIFKVPHAEVMLKHITHIFNADYIESTISVIDETIAEIEEYM